MKRISLLSILAIVIFFVSSCSNANKTPDETKILSDFIVKRPEYSYANFNEATFIRQQYFKGDKHFTADLRLNGKDEYANYETEINVTYNYYDEQGWMIDSYKNKNIVCKCFQGMTEE